MQSHGLLSYFEGQHTYQLLIKLCETTILCVVHVHTRKALIASIPGLPCRMHSKIALHLDCQQTSWLLSTFARVTDCCKSLFFISAKISCSNAVNANSLLSLTYQRLALEALHPRTMKNLFGC